MYRRPLPPGVVCTQATGHHNWLAFLRSNYRVECLLERSPSLHLVQMSVYDLNPPLEFLTKAQNSEKRWIEEIHSLKKCLIEWSVRCMLNSMLFWLLSQNPIRKEKKSEGCTKFVTWDQAPLSFRFVNNIPADNDYVRENVWELLKLGLISGYKYPLHTRLYTQQKALSRLLFSALICMTDTCVWRFLTFVIYLLYRSSSLSRNKK